MYIVDMSLFRHKISGVPLVIESLSWEHGVMVGAAVKSEATSAAEFKGRHSSQFLVSQFIHIK